CHSATATPAGLETIRAELDAAGIALPSILVATKLDDAEPGAVERLAQATGLVTVGVSVLDDDSLEALREELWRLTGLIRVFLRRPGDADAEPLALTAGSTVADAA